MGLNINDGIDKAAIQEVTREIFQRAAAKSSAPRTQSVNFDFSKFKKADLGLDLYNSDAQTAKQVALLNSGIEVQLSAKAVSSLTYLNNVASKASVLTIDATKVQEASEEAKNDKKVLQFPKFNSLVKTTNSDSDKKGSNPFYPGNIAKGKKVAEEEEELSLIA